MSPTPMQRLNDQEAPWPDWSGLEEPAALTRLEELMTQLRDENRDAAQLIVAGLGNYVSLWCDWPDFMQRANELINELRDPGTRRWGWTV